MPLSRTTRPRCGRAQRPGLVMRLLGTAETWLDGQRLLLNRRQTEVLALLAMHPEGLSLEHLHALVYGDQAVTLSTLKAEVSHLRAALGGQLASRPYRLTMPISTDVELVLGLLRRAGSPPPSTRTAATCCRAPTPRRSPSSPSTSPSRSARRCSPTRSPTRSCATASSRRTTPRSRGLPGGARRPPAPRRTPPQGAARGRRRS